MKIILKTLSPLLSSSGESSAQFDADVKYDKLGFPYIQGKTFKGLLRESAEEVTEITNSYVNKVNELFGLPGDTKGGTLKFNNLFLLKYKEMVKEISSKGKNNVLSASAIRTHYTVYRKQTSINEAGTAVETTLRNYRLIDEGLEFETEIENVPPGDVEFIKKSISNLRYMGLRRNRGFGKIKITPADKATYPAQINSPFSSPEVVPTPTANPVQRLLFNITTNTSLLISKIIGEQNTVSTEHFIPAQNIRGLIASLLLKSVEPSAPHLKGETFEKIILSGDVKFNNAFLCGTQPVPRVYGFDKTLPEKKRVALNLFEEKHKNTVLKGLKGFAAIENGGLFIKETSTSFSFHSSRMNNRLAGRSTENDGGIFYYEAIDEGQSFETEIIGNKDDLVIIYNLLSENNGEHRMGRSKTAQYSKVVFNGFKYKDLETTADQKNPFYIVFQSPVITCNDFGMAIPDYKILESDLKIKLGNESLKIKKMASVAVQVEQYMSIWKTKTPRELAFDIGTTLQVMFTGGIPADKIKNLETNGLGERKNEGFGRVKIMNLEPELKMPKSLPKVNKKDINSVSFNNVVLIKIYDKLKDDLKLDPVRIKAMSANMPNPNAVPNSLIGRMKDKLKESTDKNKWDAFIREITGKKANKTLDNAKLWESLKGLHTPEDCNTFELKKEYWLTYFKALRFHNNKHRNHGKGIK